MAGELIVVGSLNMDLSVAVPRLAAPGETVAGADVVRGAGGKGANQAVAAARLGGRVRMVGLVGDDAFGIELRAGLAAEGVDDRAVGQLDGVPSGLALIVVQDDGENTITLSPGANARLDVPTLERLTGGRLAGPGDTVLLQLEVPLPTVLAAAHAARAAGALAVLNAAPLPAPGPQTDRLLGQLLSCVDVLVVNESEAAGLGADPAALRARGPATVVVTLGAAGALAVDAQRSYREPGFAVAAVDTVGAGDAFCGALALALGAGLPLPQALRQGCAAGALAATRPGAQASLPTGAEVSALLGG
ncbi:ribokinase [Kitasatospora sp. McL0602]|uniref:ribokinase n=1 Tax=Kitasatospora sp. McL0602 TaxID=3439530 RepID=UPI003F8CBF0E